MTTGRREGELGSKSGKSGDLFVLVGDGGRHQEEPDDAPCGGPRAVKRPQRGRAVRRVLVGLVVVCLLLVGAAALGIYGLTESIGNNVARVPNVFGDLDDDARPAVDDALTFLLVGGDLDSAQPTTGTDATPSVKTGAVRSDVLMLARVNAERTEVGVVSIPRDSWVDIPIHGRNKVNAAFALGGPPLLIQTVENLTQIRIDHYLVIDFAGFQAMVDAVGGIDVGIAEATSNHGVDFFQGVNHLDGGAALAYVRQRRGLPHGDLDRAQRQQNALRGLLAKAASSGMLSDPVRLYGLLDATSRSVSVDDTLSNGGLRQLAFDVRGLRPSNVTFLSAPVGALGQEGSQSVVYLDDNRGAELWAALRGGTTPQYASRYPADSLGSAPY